MEKHEKENSLPKQYPNPQSDDVKHLRLHLDISKGKVNHSPDKKEKVSIKVKVNSE